MLAHDQLLTTYGRTDRSRRWVRANFVASLDGAATHDGHAGGLGDPEDQQVLLLLRSLADVVVVGAGTVRAEGYGGLGVEDPPPLAIVSASLDLDPTAAVFTAPGPRPLVVTHGRAPADRRAALAPVAEVLVCGDDVVDLHVLLDTLAARGMTQVLCEGGPRLFGSFVAADVLDELCLTLSPQLEGGSATRISRGDAQTTRPMRLGHAIAGERMLFLRYEREG
ncbi:pyrimidine reductase family protein [Georgenia sp. MJ173]|uniref:pyrimidine reductase family protein n=1 Tax=Georgenia sunbinii TaxID=3117728 RepID=UPI002F2637C9